MPVTPDPAIHYRPFTTADLHAAHGLSIALNWPHREADWAMAGRVGEGFVAEREGRLVGVAFVTHQGDYSSIGLVIVSAAHQGQGIGRRLMQSCLDAAQPRTAILNATTAGVPLYRRMGFVDYGCIQQHQGVARLAGLPPAGTDTSLQILGPADHGPMIALASVASGLDRRLVLEDLLADAERAVGIVVEGRLQGAALLRQFGRGYLIGPVIARHSGQAQQLIGHLLGQVPGGAFVRLDILAGCGLADWLESLGLACVGQASRMVRGTPPLASPTARPFALVTQALG